MIVKAALGRLQDKVLEAKILHLAHIADKNLATAPEARETLMSLWGEKLGAMLQEWWHRGLPHSATIRWAEEVLAELKAEPTSGEMVEQHTCGDILELIRTRRSVRNWTDQPVREEDIGRLLEAARWAPSSGNRQATRIVVIRDERLRESVLQLKEQYLRKAPVILLVGVDLRVYLPSERDRLTCLDAAAAIQNMLLVAHSLGLGCVWCKLCVDDWETHPRMYFDMKRSLRLPGYFLPVSIIAVGWAARPSRVPPRHELVDFVRFDAEGFQDDRYPEWKPPRMRNAIRALKSSCLRAARVILKPLLKRFLKRWTV